MGETLDCSAIVVILDAGPLVTSCLDSLRKMGLDETIFVDGGSLDGTADFLRNQPDVKLLEMPKESVTARLLAGVRHARNDYVFVLCDDDIISAEDVRDMLNAMKKTPELDGLQFTIQAPQRNYWERGWNTYFALITETGKRIAALGRPCIAKRANFLELRDPPQAFGDDTWIHLQEKGKNRMYKVGNGLTIRSCPNTARWNATQFRKYGEADSGVSGIFRQHVKLLFHTAIRIAILRSFRALLMGRPGAATFISWMGLSRSYHHLRAWFGSENAESLMR